MMPIKEWLEYAKANNFAYVIIAVDPDDYDSYPIYCRDGQECVEIMTRLFKMGQRTDEVYDLSLSIEDQLAEQRAFHLPDRDDG